VTRSFVADLTQVDGLKLTRGEITRTRRLARVSATYQSLRVIVSAWTTIARSNSKPLTSSVPIGQVQEIESVKDEPHFALAVGRRLRLREAWQSSVDATKLAVARLRGREGVIMGVEQHLVGLLRVSPEDEGAAAGQFEVSDLQLGPLAGNNRPIFRPVELERLAKQECKRHEHAAAARLLFLLPGCLPVAKAATRLYEPS
jgi:hypothetical protein